MWLAPELAAGPPSVLPVWAAANVVPAISAAAAVVTHNEVLMRMSPFLDPPCFQCLGRQPVTRSFGSCPDASYLAISRGIVWPYERPFRYGRGIITDVPADLMPSPRPADLIQGTNGRAGALMLSSGSKFLGNRAMV